MPELSFAQAAEASGLPARTLERRLGFIRKNDAPTYDGLIARKEGRTLYYDPDRLLPLLADWAGYNDRLATPQVRPVPAKPAKPAKPAQHTRKTATRTVATPPPAAAPPPPPQAAKLKNPARERALQELLTEEVYIIQPTPGQLAVYHATSDPKMRARLDVVIPICQHYATGEYTSAEACATQGITDRTLRLWCKNYAPISVLWRKAQKKGAKAKRQALGHAALDGLRELVTGRTLAEEYGIYETHRLPNGATHDVLVGKRTRTRYERANPQAVFFALVNSSPENFRAITQQLVADDDDQQLADAIDRMTPEQRQQRLHELLITQGWAPPAGYVPPTPQPAPAGEAATYAEEEPAVEYETETEEENE